MRWAAVASATLAAGLVLGGCTPDGDDAFTVPPVGPARLAVDTPELRELKQRAGIEPCEPGEAGPGSNQLPAVTLPCLGGGPDVSLDRLEGPLVVTVWAQWCTPCRRELPLLGRFAEEYAGRVDVLGIDYTDQYPAAAIKLLRESGATFPQVADWPGETQGRAPFPAQTYVPMLALVDRDGEVHVEITVIDSYDELTGLVEEHLGVRA